ncbi:MAG: glycoside hydrolase family 97 catalytic domain-containing protein [Prevotella sp.]|nr:glycoside hydrolase family 97 catalytic domain-containing protein [Prevotella sp.]
MKRFIIYACALLAPAMLWAEDKTVTSPDGKLVVTVSVENGLASYTVAYDGQQVLGRSALGLRTNLGDFTKELTLQESKTGTTKKDYTMTRTKQSQFHYEANTLALQLQTSKQVPMTIDFYVSNNDIAFRYQLGRGPKDNTRCAVIESEATSFNLPEETRSFICPQITPMTGWERTKPSYEEEYKPDMPVNTKSQYGVGYTFPCLFRQEAKEAGNVKSAGNIWVQISETGVTSDYCGARLSDYEAGKGYTVAYPQAGENNGFGSTSASIMLPGYTPWRTITVGNSLKPIVETTVQFDVLEPLYKATEEYKPGRYTWSWIIWQDDATVYDDQVQFIDLAAAMGYEYCLVDALWDTQIGYDRIEELARYARSKNVALMLWYNSNGAENDAPQGPRGVMSNSIKRKQDMAWMKRIGVKAIKVDFFGGDKQETLRLYEEILSDANDYGIQVIFHGCTLPRGWERLYPNFVGSEAALASENVYFTEYHAKKEGFEMAMHPFSRNAVGSFDWGGILMNHHMSRDNKSRHPRYTSDVFEMATAITNQCSVNCVAMCPNNLTDLPAFELDFLRQVPTTWDETCFIDGYPTRYAVIARKSTNGRWYVGGINGTDEPITLTLQLPMFAGQTVSYYTDNARQKDEIIPTSLLKELKVNKKGEAKVTLQPMGGIIIM